jgi:hypothetical protein
MSALASALVISGQTETLVSRNHESAAQARAAAEAGLNHASETVITWILAFKQNGFDDAAEAMDALLVGVDGDPDFLVGVTFGDAGEPTAIAGASDGEYHVFLMDEDDEDARSDDATDLTGDAPTWNDEDGNPLTDANRAVVIQAVGYAGRLRQGGNVATARLEAIISPYRFPAIAADGDLTINGSAVEVTVSNEAIGGVHANGDLTFSGSSSIVGSPPELGTATSPGDCEDCLLDGITTNPMASGGGKPRLEIPKIRASDFETWADYILHDDGNIEDTTTGLTVASCAKSCSLSGWSYQSKSQEWTLTSTMGLQSTGTFYVEGPVTISAGTLANPAVATIIAEGTINASGNNHIVPDAGDLLFVTDKDLELSGSFQAGTLLSQGQMLVHEQIAISGNAVIFGQIVVENATTTETPDVSDIGGSVAITNTQDVGSSMFHVSGWREVR